LAFFVLDKQKKPLMPYPPKRARQLLERGRAVVHKPADVPKGRKAGIHVRHLAVRARGSFDVGSVTDINGKHVCLLQRSAGYGHDVSASPVNPLNLSTLPS
jgi:hypothetical protein